MQPYQRASEAIRAGEEYPLKILQNAGLAALGGGVASAGSKALNKLIPAVSALINDYVPDNIAINGLKKIDPRFGEFIKDALEEGYTFDDVRSNLREKVEKSQEPAKENRNVIEQYSPELHQFIDQELKKGRSVLQAGAIAQNNKKFAGVIKKMSEDHKTPWSNILQSVYGQEAPQQPAQQQTQQPQQAQPGGIDPQIAEILNMGKQIVGKFRGPRG